MSVLSRNLLFDTLLKNRSFYLHLCIS